MGFVWNHLTYIIELIGLSLGHFIRDKGKTSSLSATCKFIDLLQFVQSLCPIDQGVKQEVVFRDEPTFHTPCHLI